MENRITLADIEAMDKEFLTPTEVAEYLGMGIQNTRVSIRNGVPWAYMMNNATFVIPKQAFVNYHKYGAVIQIKER